MNVWVRTGVVAVLVAAGTILLDWWVVPLIGFGWGLLLVPAARPVMSAAAGGFAGWVALLAWTALQGPVPALAARAGAVMGIGGWGLVGLTLLFPAVLAGAAATLGAALRTRV